MRRKDIKDNPDLRFPEFAEPYILRKFGELLTKKARSFKMEDESEYRLVTVKRRYGGVVLREVFKGKEVLVKSQFLLKSGDFLISKRQICHNACGIVPSSLEGAIVSNEYTVFLPKSDLDITYFSYFCCLPIISHTFFLSSIGVHIEKMLFKVDDWLKWEFPFPPLPEQQKIVSFLAAVDKKIEQLTRKKELLEQYKKGVMQKIFSQEIRFKDENGQNYPDWEENRIGEIATLLKDGSHGSHKNYNNSGYYLLSAKNIIDGSLRIDNNDRQISEIDFAAIYKNFCLKENDLLLTIVGTIGRVGLFNGAENIAFQRSVAFLRFENDSSIFLYHFFTSSLFQKELRRRQVVSAQPGIYLGDLAKIHFLMPSQQEQKKIACFLSNIDHKVTVTRTQLTQTQNFKKGLLQKMFV